MGEQVTSSTVMSSHKHGLQTECICIMVFVMSLGCLAWMMFLAGQLEFPSVTFLIGFRFCGLVFEGIILAHPTQGCLWSDISR